MEDNKIVDLYWARDEKAIAESESKYGKLLHALSLSLLASHEDAEECVNDTYLDAWKAMPAARPAYLGAFLAKITRRISIDRYRLLHRQRRGGIREVTEELTDCIPDSFSMEADYENKRLAQTINRFLAGQSEEKRAIFLRRYFCSQSVEEIASALQLTESKVKVTLHRMREALRKELEERELL